MATFEWISEYGWIAACGGGPSAENASAGLAERPDFLKSPIFAVATKGKMRSVPDFTASGLNGLEQVSAPAKMDTLGDFFAAAAA